MEKIITKKQHYIPQFYLKRFTDNSGYLHIYDFEKQRYIKSVPKEFGYEKYLYETRINNPNNTNDKFLLPNQLENTFVNYEGQFASALVKLDHICTPDQNPNAMILYPDEKEILYHFIANLLFRNPVTMDLMNINEAPQDVFASEEKDSLNALLKMINGCTIDELLVSANKKAMLTNEYEENNIKAFIDSIRKLKFVFMLSLRKHFITSSFPITIGYDPTIKCEDKTCIHCVLSPKLSVLFGNYGAFIGHHNRMITIDNNSIVSEFNDQEAKPIFNHNRALIASSKEDLMKYIKNKG